MSKKGYCVYFFSHRGIGKIVQEEKDYKKSYKEIKKNQPGNEIFCVGCGPDIKIATENYNIDMIKEKKLIKKEQSKKEPSKKRKRQMKGRLTKKKNTKKVSIFSKFFK